MESKKLNTHDISKLLGIEYPKEISGGTVERDWVASAISRTPGCENIDMNLKKQDLLKAGIEALGGKWDDSCKATGSTISGIGFSRFAICIEPRLKEMREIWDILGKKDYPGVDHNDFISLLYSHYFNREMSEGMEISINQILNHIDENHGLSDEEIMTEDGPNRGTYQVILNDLFHGSQDESDEESDFLTGIIRTSVTAESIDTLVNLYQRGRLNLNPPWQRGDVWSPKKKKAVVESIMLGIPLPAIILHKNSKTGSHEVIDGQQRLRSIVHFVENRFPLAKFDRGHDLYDVSSHYYDHETKRSIDDYWRDRFALEKIPVLTFEDVSDSTLRKVFNLYNTASMKLNAAEIRNATYQTHPVHQMAFTLAGENSNSEVLHVDGNIQKSFTSDWRQLGSTNRFAATELICQYFAYSRPERSSNSNVFKGTSTANSINRFLDINRPSESNIINEMAQELIDSYYFTEDYFDLENGENYAFERNDKNGVPKYNKLATITNMVASRMLKKLLDGGFIDEGSIEDAIETVIPSVEWPENQNAGTMWGYQADVINGLLDHLQIQSDNPEILQILPKLIPCMNEIRN